MRGVRADYPTTPLINVHPMRLRISILSAILSLPLHAQSAVAIRNATVIDGTGAPPRPGYTVVVRGGRIVAVGPVGSTRIPPGARVLNGSGQFVLPGFIDVHAHYDLGPTRMDTTPTGVVMRVTPDHDGGMESLRTLLAFGVTTIRNPAGHAATTVAIRDSVRLGLVPGPRILTAGEAIDGIAAVDGLSIVVKTEQQARDEVDRQAALGVDYVKLYAGLGPTYVRAAIDQAHRKGIRAIGHLFLTSWTDAANAGIDGIVHITPGSPLLLRPDKRVEFQRRFRGTQFMLEWFNFVDPQSAEIQAMLEALRTHRVFVDPTLVTFEAMAWGDSTRITESPDLAYAPPSIVRSWHSFALSAGWKPEDFAEAGRAWPHVLEYTKLLYDAGVPLTAGTDMSNPWTVPGASFHRELQLLSAAGIPNLEVLRIATRNGAWSLGLETEIGSVAVGKVADLVVLTGDPVQDIQNTRRIAYVVQGGVVSTPEALLPPTVRARVHAR
ncbi:MAG: amidohydrolase family protein [Gemmatimonadaceae bacterium]